MFNETHFHPLVHFRAQGTMYSFPVLDLVQNLPILCHFFGFLSLLKPPSPAPCLDVKRVNFPRESELKHKLILLVSSDSLVIIQLQRRRQQRLKVCELFGGKALPSATEAVLCHDMVVVSARINTYTETVRDVLNDVQKNLLSSLQLLQLDKLGKKISVGF